MGAIFEALGGGLRGLQEGLLLREDMKQRKFQNEGETLERQMQQREFGLRMKQLGLQLEEAEYKRDLRIATGTPQEVAQREYEQDLLKAEREHQKHEAAIKEAESRIRENEAQTEYHRQGGARGRASGVGAGGDGSNDKTNTEALKIIDGQIRVFQGILDNPESAPEDREYANGQLRQLYDQREILVNSQLAQMGLPMDQFGVGRTEQPSPTAIAKKEPDALERILRPQQETEPVMAGQLKLPDWMTRANPLAGYGGAWSALMEGVNAYSPLAPREQIPGVGNVNLNYFTPDMIRRAREQGLVGQPSTSAPPGTSGQTENVGVLGMLRMLGLAR